MSDEELRALEREAASDAPDAVDRFVAALRRAGDDERAWWVMVASLERRALAAELRLSSVARNEPYDVEHHRHALIEAGRTIDLARRLPSLDGREHLQWLHGQRVRIKSGCPQAKPPPGEDARPRAVPPGTEGRVIYIARPAIYRGRQRIEPEAKLQRGMVAMAGDAWRIGLRIEGHDALDGWAVFTTAHNLERVPGAAWDVLDAKSEEQRLAAAGALPARGAKVRAQVRDPRDGLLENVVGKVCWAGVTTKGPRVGIERPKKPTVWVDLDDVEVLGPPPPPRCVRIRFRG